MTPDNSESIFSHGRRHLRETIQAIMRGVEIDDPQAHGLLEQIVEWHEAGRPTTTKFIEQNQQERRLREIDQHIHECKGYAHNTSCACTCHSIMEETVRMQETRKEIQYIELRPEVRWFAEQMELKLIENNWKGGWQDKQTSYLFQRLEEESSELADALFLYGASNRHNGGNRAIQEAVEIANFAMMVATNIAHEIYNSGNQHDQ